MKRAVTYVDAIRYVVKQFTIPGSLLGPKEMVDVDHLHGTLLVGTISELFEADPRIVATDVVREYLAPGSVTS